jgi:CRP-like cAMP-binding protein
VWKRLEPQAQRTLLFQGQVLYEAGAPVERVYFLNSGLVSFVLVGADGEQVEVAMAGREGAVGALEGLSGTVMGERAVVQVPGTACWLPVGVIREEFKRGGALAEWTMRSWAFVAAQKAQAALCNRLHSVEQRLARWLLCLADRVESTEIEITHGSIAQMLGARRSGVTVALGAMASQNLLSTGRGRIHLLDLDGLRASSCSCNSCLGDSLAALRESSRLPSSQQPSSPVPTAEFGTARA